MCADGKLSYPSRHAAHTAARALANGRGKRHGKPRQSQVYRCPHPDCRGWHLMSAKSRRKPLPAPPPLALEEWAA